MGVCRRSFSDQAGVGPVRQGAGPGPKATKSSADILPVGCQWLQHANVSNHVLKHQFVTSGRSCTIFAQSASPSTYLSLCRLPCFTPTVHFVFAICFCFSACAVYKQCFVLSVFLWCMWFCYFSSPENARTKCGV